MTFQNRMNRATKNAVDLTWNPKDKYILFSDVHRGAGDYKDRFIQNQQVFFAALQYYCKEGYTYIEIGDGDELWENREFFHIREAHEDVFWLMSRMYEDGRFYMIYGNHDMVKKTSRYCKSNCEMYYCDIDQCNKALFPGIRVPEGYRLRQPKTGYSILLTHGHQGDLINDALWKVGRFLVRYLWGPLNEIGLVEPTSAARNHQKTNRIEKRLIRWSSMQRELLIVGHTHRAFFPCPNDQYRNKRIKYFNTGSCVSPRCITGIEIQNQEITLIKWCLSIREDRTLCVAREILEGPIPIAEYFNPDSHEKS